MWCLFWQEPRLRWAAWTVLDWNVAAVWKRTRKEGRWQPRVNDLKIKLSRDHICSGYFFPKQLVRRVSAGVQEQESRSAHWWPI